jgi:hypothetical protein
VNGNNDGLDFLSAMRQMMAGYKLTRRVWDNPDAYGLVTQGFLMIHKAGEPPMMLHQWILNDGDIFAEDWVELAGKLDA